MNVQTRSRYTGTHVFQIMASRGQKRSWLAAELGCHRTMISKIALGQRPIPQWFVDGCVRLFGLPETALFFVSSDGIEVPVVGPDRLEPAEVAA